MSSNKINIVPYLLVRLSDESTTAFNRFVNAGGDVGPVLEKIQFLKESMMVLKNIISEALYQLISVAPDSASQNQLLNFRRAFHNDRLHQLGLFKENDHLDAALRQKLKDFFLLKENYAAEITNIISIYNEKLSLGRQELTGLLQKNSFQNALLWSSGSLYDAYKRYYESSEQRINKKFLNTEKSLLKYVSRMYTKTSPFSSFTNVGICTINKKDTGTISSSEKISFIRVNNYILKFFLDVLKTDQAFLSRLPVKINPTSELQDDFFSFLASTHSGESFQKLKANAVLQLIFELFSKRELIILEELTTYLTDRIDAGYDQVCKYLFNLINYGFLEIEFGISGVDPHWDEKLLAVLGNARFIDLEIVNAIRDSVAMLNSGRKTLQETDDLKTRKQILETSFALFKSKSISLLDEIKYNQSASEASDIQVEKKFIVSSIPKFNFRAENIFFEDTTRDTDYHPDRLWLEPKITQINDLLDSMFLFDYPLSRRRRLMSYFRMQYGETAQVDFLTFYHDYFKDVERNVDNPLKVSDNGFTKAKKDFLEDLSDFLTGLDLKADSISLHLCDFKKLSAKYDHLRPQKNSRHSRGIFYQVIKGQEGDSMVLNEITIGYGRMFSRFLHLFDNSVLQDFRNTNDNLAGESVFVENCDGSFFNGNIHPMLMANEIKAPNSNNNTEGIPLINVKDIHVVIAEDDLVLCDKRSGKEVFIFDLGFQGLGRSQLFQLLNFFTLPQSVLIKPILTAIEKRICREKEITSFEEATETIVIPRINYEEEIIVQRKRWIVPVNVIPKRQSADDAIYYSELVSWAVLNQIPLEVFVVLNTNRWQIKAEDAKLNQDDYKPQYINFQSPVFVNLFEEMVGRASQYIRLEEMAPDFNSSLSFSGQNHTSEFIVNWTSM